jgi:hypothetical protein
MSIVDVQADITARAEAQCCNGAAAGGHRLRRAQTYLHAHLALKVPALTKRKPYECGKPTRFRANDRLLAFVDAL